MEDIKRKIAKFEEELASLKDPLKIENKRKEISSIQAKMNEQDFWNDSQAASKLMTELKSIKTDVDIWDDLYKRAQDLKELLSISEAAYEGELVKEAEKLDKDLEKLRLSLLFSDRFDSSNAIVEINSGAGGTESCDWASMLYRMYYRFAEERKFNLSVLVEVRAEEAGIKNITFLIEGLRAFGLLKSERGVHRLVRVSPFDANKRRHTSFASVSVIPEVKEDIDIEIKPEDLKSDTYRASGAGGQHVNKTESAIRITHIPSGIVVACQTERSQHQNKIVALRVIKAKLYELQEQKRQSELDNISGEKRKIEWGSQIRSYVLYPYLMIKDHRTNYEEHDAKSVLDGKIDGFIYSFLKWDKTNM